VRPIERVRVWSRSGTRAEEFALSARKRGDLEVVVCSTAREAVQEADVVCTITSARTPVLHGEWLSPGTHVNAVGASMAGARELDTAAVRRAAFYVDRRESALAEAGDFLIPRSEGAIDDMHILGELGDLVSGTAVGRTARDQVTLFKSLGLAVEDVAALRHVYDRASREGAGTQIGFGGLRLHE
jgi:ornithine cyclodeaminase